MAQHFALVYHLMDRRPDLQAALILLLLSLLLLMHLARQRSNSKGRLPPSPPALPVIGHLHLVKIRDHVALRDLAWKHGGGDLMFLRLGTVPYLVASSPRAARAVLRTHDHLMASRPSFMVADVLMYGSSDLVFAPYGELWRLMKRLVTIHLFSAKKVQSYCLARQQEVRLVIGKLREAAAASAAVDLSEMMSTFSNELVCRVLSGDSLRAQGRSKMFQELIQANTALFKSSNLENCFPGLAKLADLLTGFNLRNKARKVNRRWDNVLEILLQNHERKLTTPREEEEESNFIAVLLSVQHDYNGITRDHIKAILMDMLAAGTDSSFFVLDVAMAELMRRPEVMAKLQAEVRNHTPMRQEMVEEENLDDMKYLKAVLKETLRLHPPLPLLLPHLTVADCDDVLDGYSVPSRTRVVINAWAIGRDPDAWERPGEFLPERFMEGGGDMAVDFGGNDFGFVPFGAGRRICPARNFGMAAIEIMLANLVHRLDWALPPGMEKEDIDMTEVFGISVRRKEKLELVPKNHQSG